LRRVVITFHFGRLPSLSRGEKRGEEGSPEGCKEKTAKMAEPITFFARE
jgi:hypothetical protein